MMMPPWPELRPGVRCDRDDHISVTCEPLACCDQIWEDTYLRFESPREEIRNFQQRLRRFGCALES
jgi:hypothetical protein